MQERCSETAAQKMLDVEGNDRAAVKGTKVRDEGTFAWFCFDPPSPLLHTK